MDNKYSKQRATILEVIKNTHAHPNIEELCSMVKEKDNNISKSTVYRNIKILVEQNIVRKILVEHKPDRYDYICSPHHHMVCSICSKVIDFNYDFCKEINIDKIKEQVHTDVNLDSITINGICDDCKLKLNTK